MEPFCCVGQHAPARTYPHTHTQRQHCLISLQKCHFSCIKCPICEATHSSLLLFTHWCRDMKQRVKKDKWNLFFPIMLKKPLVENICLASQPFQGGTLWMAMPETKITPNNLPQDCIQISLAAEVATGQKRKIMKTVAKVEHRAPAVSLLWNPFSTSHSQEVQRSLEFSASAGDRKTQTSVWIT